MQQTEGLAMEGTIVDVTATTEKRREAVKRSFSGGDDGVRSVDVW